MIRQATIDDAAQIVEIYRLAVESTVASFEEVVPSLVEMRRRIDACLRDYPWLVDDEDGALRGFAYATAHRARAAYRWSADCSVYVASNSRRQGVGRGLYQVLFATLGAQGMRSVFAGISEPNDASTGLHKSLGFERLGVYRQVGFKLGQWRDVSWWQLSLQEAIEAPEEPIEFAKIAEHWRGDLSGRGI